MDKTNEFANFEEKFERMSDDDKQKIIQKVMDEEKQKDFYEKLRNKVNKYVKEHPNSKYINYLIAAPDFFHLMCKLLLDKRVPLKNKAMLAAAMAYFISPVDLITDVIPGIGVMDDILIAVYVVNSLLESVDKDVIKELWAGDDDVIDFMERFLEFANSKFGNSFITKILKLIGVKLR